MSQKDIQRQTHRRALRVRSRIGKGSTPRVSVFRSASHIYAQVIDDKTSATIASCSSLELKNLTGDKKQIAQNVGKELAKRASEKGVKSAIFDRGPFLYHGRVKALAEGLREGGLTI